MNEYEIIAETAFSHEGDIAYLKKQINAAYKGGADFVKFQLILNANNYFVDGHPSKSLISKFILSEKDWLTAFKYAHTKGLRIICLPIENEAFEFCKRNIDYISMIEVHSVSFNEVTLLEKLKGINIPIILGVGGRVLSEIVYALKILNSNNIILMYGFQSFPTDSKLLNLLKITEFKKIFNLEIGFADHTAFNEDYHELNSLAFSLGTKYFEKHIVIDSGVQRTDYNSAISADGFIEMRNSIEKCKGILGDGMVSRLNIAEQSYKCREKQLVFSRKLNIGSVIQRDDLIYRIVEGSSLSEQSDYDNIIGKSITETVNKFEKVNLKILK